MAWEREKNTIEQMPGVSCAVMPTLSIVYRLEIVHELC